MSKLLEIDILNVDKFIKVTRLLPVSNPIFFKRDNIPTDDGLLSNSIFGTTKYDRSTIFSYIDLGSYFFNPLIYLTVIKLCPKIKDVVFGTNTFKITKDGELVEDPDGETGLNWLYDNFNRIKFKSTDSEKRNDNIRFIEKNKKNGTIFMDKLLVIPAFYRDVNSNGGKRKSGVGDINKLYNLIMLSVRSIKDTADYGLNMEDSVKGRLQDYIVAVYDWFCDEPNLSKKRGIIKRAVQAKTADYAARLIIASPDINYEKIDDMYIDLDHSGLPLSALCATLYPYMIFNVKRFFENEFSTPQYPYKDPKSGEIKYVTVKDPQMEFSDERIKHELDRYIKGFSNRFVPIEVPNEEGKKIYMKFKGVHATPGQKDEFTSDQLLDRRLTWCDVFFIAACESCRGKHVLTTRYPLTDYFGQFPTKIRVLSTKETECIMVNGEIYPKYPKIREEDIGRNTSNMFVDALNISNLYLDKIGGDYRKPHCSLPCAMHRNKNLLNCWKLLRAKLATA